MNGASFSVDVSLAMELAPLEDDVVVDFGAAAVDAFAFAESCATAKLAAESRMVATTDIGRDIGPLPRET
jgi:hypothetical protein